MADESKHNLVGNYFVRSLRAAFRQADRLFPKRRDRALLWRYSLGLRYWPERHPVGSSGKVLDLDYSVVRGLENLKIYELRINEIIGGMDNLRVIFHVAPTSDQFPKTCIWLLTVLQKKRDDFTTHQLDTFRDLRTLVHQRFYGEGP